MRKNYFVHLVVSCLVALPCVALGVLIGNWTQLWIFETWGEILYTYVGVSVIIFFADAISRPLFKNKS